VYTYLSEYGSVEPPLWGPLARIPLPLGDYVYSRKESPQWLEVVKPRVPGGCFDQLELMLLGDFGLIDVCTHSIYFEY
jgi:hypothetical protein